MNTKNSTVKAQRRTAEFLYADFLPTIKKRTYESTHHYLGIGALIGALLSGIILRQVLLKEPGHKPWERIEITRTIHTIAIGGTLFGTALGYYLSHKNWNEGLLIEWAMNAKGDTELIIAQLALSVGAITPALFSALIFVAIVSTLISPLMLRPLLEKV